MSKVVARYMIDQFLHSRPLPNLALWPVAVKPFPPVLSHA
jgi:hypothetical protein